MPILSAVTIGASLLDVQTIIDGELPAVDWVVDRLIAKGDRVLVYGEPGSLKSWLMLDLGLHIAAGTPWLGHFEIPERKRVLYIDEEMSPRTLIRRVKRLIEGSDLETDSLPFKALTLCGVRFTDESVGTTLLAGLATHGFSPEVVIIETMRRVLHGSENNADEVGAFWRCVDLLRKEGRSLIITHHMKKPSMHGANESVYRASGSTDVLGGSDSAFAVEKLQANKVCVTCVRARNTPEASPFYVSLHDTGPETPASMRFEGQGGALVVPQSRVEEVANWIEEYLRDQQDQQATTAQIRQNLDTAHRVSSDRCEKALRRLRETGRVTQPVHGAYRIATQQEVASVTN
ncbi:hypothetical protein DNFV4_02740 [Nitrospira tepida]|uniref:AAA+ ATPase domain-containing protein n=1 Tax=Nitrospira tepida TaxID=2973512 RepID=A0AA86T5Z4_9BACT|nr:AAA family ATPase [Nitrospira tepida]CAI4032311.1 hypothetical protein DNFV4_02740 [Nitrospira tepida]